MSDEKRDPPASGDTNDSNNAANSPTEPRLTFQYWNYYAPYLNENSNWAFVARLQASNADAILVYAPAGFGKSTLLTQWASAANASGTNVAWLNLDEEDRHADQFAAYIVAAVRRALDRARSGSHDNPRSTLAPAGELLALIGEVSRNGRRIVLVLEDYHRAECEELNLLLRRFLERVSPWICVAISSRTMPNVGVARLKAEGRAVVVTERELRFNRAETNLFFDAVLPTGGAGWTRFAERAEGWPVALQFARMWLSEGGDVAALGVASETSDLGAYLSDQMFSGLRPAVRDFLLRTSLLEDISAEVAQALGVEKRTKSRAKSRGRPYPLHFSRMNRCVSAAIICCTTFWSCARVKMAWILEVCNDKSRAGSWSAGSSPRRLDTRWRAATLDTPPRCSIRQAAGG